MAGYIVTDDLVIVAHQKTKERQYWLEQLAGELTDGRFPSDRQTERGKVGELASVPFPLPDELQNRLKKLANNSDLRLFMVLTTGLTLLLNQYTGLDDIILGTPVQRQDGDADFINTVLPLRQRLQDDTTFKSLLLQVRDTLAGATEHQNFPLITLRNVLASHLPEDRSFPFRTAIVLEELHDSSYLDVAEPELIFSFRQAGQGLQGAIYYRTGHFHAATMERLGRHFVSLLEQAVQNPDTSISALDWITKEESDQLRAFNDTVMDYPRESTVVQLFDRQALSTPDRLAVVGEDASLTYAQLQDQANRVATALLQKGIGHGQIVGLLLDRTTDIVVALLGIMKTGAAYLPVSKNIPENRVQDMLEDCASPLLITEEVLADLRKAPAGELPVVDNPRDLAYVIFTSGSTGRPKGTMIEHRSVINFIWGFNREVYARYEAPLRIGHVHPFEFDSSVQNLFGALLYGHTLYIAPEAARADGAKLLDFLQRHQIEVTDGTPTHLRLLVEQMTGHEQLVLKHTIAQGEALPPLVAKSFLDRFNVVKPILTNAYGPTETTVDSSCFHVEYAELSNLPSLPIGKPLGNQKILIVGANNQLQPIGVPGELCITGDGLARGYLNRPELTKEKFPVNPFANDGDGTMDESRIYRTGDLARWLPDGNIQFLGRLDHQVKIRGMRIELGEIENRLLAHPAVREVVVLAHQLKEESYPFLCAYFVPQETVEPAELRHMLSETLPYYMVPSYLIAIESIPVTTNGKTDRKALPVPRKQQASTEYIAPRNDVEEKLVSIWSRILDVKQVGVYDSFFELGGNSLQVTAVAAQIQREIGVNLPLRDLFQKTTIAEIATCVTKAEAASFQAIQPRGKAGHHPISSAQKRLYILNRFEGIGTTYNIPGVLLVEGFLDKSRLEEAVCQLVKRHESLRTTFQFVDGEPVQLIAEEVELEIEHFITSDTTEVQTLINEFIRPFDLKKAPLMRMGLISVQEQETAHWLLFDLHHIIADGLSLALLEQEFIALYAGEELEPLALQYKDYAAWQRERMNDSELQCQAEYWMEQLGGELPLLQLPTDRPRPINQSFEGDRFTLSLPTDLSRLLERFAEQQGVTLYMVLLAVYNVLLHRYTQEEDIIVGTPIAARTHSDLDSMIGMFVNTLVMRNKPQATQSFADFLGQVKTNTIEAYQHQEYPFDDLVDQLDLQRDTSRNPLFNTMLILQNISRTKQTIEGLTFTPQAFADRASKVDLTLEFHQEPTGLFLSVEYASRLYDRVTVERFTGHFLTLLEDALSNPQRSLQDLTLLSAEEEKTVVETFNQTTFDVPHQGLLHQLLKAQAARTPERTAVIFEDVTLSYKELNVRANQLARRLRERGIGAEDRVGLLFPRSAEMVIAVYAVLKAGGVYLPIDPEYPVDRIGYLLEDSGAKLLLTVTDQLEKVPAEIEAIDLKQQDLYEGEGTDLEPLTTPSSLAYILYTSGSMGKPKGVMIEHKSIVNYLYAMKEQYPWTEDDTFLLKTPYTFDVSVIELYGWTLTGARLVVLEEGGHRNPKAILRAVNEYGVRLLNFVPSMFKMFLNTLSDDVRPLDEIKYLLLAGEALPKELVEQFYSMGSTAELHNLYGPTEATVITTTFPLLDRNNHHSVPIGKPIENVRVYILDPQGRPTPIGVVGELHIAGAGLARGYLNSEELTNEKFCHSPFLDGERLYRTGDLVRWLPDGQVEFLGRIDHQVKIRGFRIELGEIESFLLKHPAVAETVVVDRHDALGNKQLIAYYIAKQNLEVAELKSHLARFLPSFMVPSLFQQLDVMPLTASGKIDRNNLPDVQVSVQEPEVLVTPPRDETEQGLVDFWKAVLNVEQVGIDDDFFELGGNSLLAVEFDLTLEEAGIKADDLVIYEHRTIRTLAEHIKERRNELVEEGENL